VPCYDEEENVESLVREFGPIPADRAIFLLRQVAHSLADAHARDLVHRDIKPANIYVCRMGLEFDFVKVLDFGLVKARNMDGQAELTGGNATIGTPLYMSPEAVERPNAVDARSDLYSVGAVGFYLVTGETLFFGGTVGEVLMQQVKSEPERPSARLGEPISPDFEELLMSCLAKKPAGRPASARELEAALARCSSASRWNREEAENWWRRFDAARAETTLVMNEEHPVPA